jgi:AcrR family transcriptional regulator
MDELSTTTSSDALVTQERRPYDSPTRRQQLAETRERILGAGSALVHGFPTWDWHALTFRAVAERAGVSERTVYRHFATERELRDAVMHRLEEEAGVSYEGIGLDDLAEVTALVFSARASFAASPAVVDDPTFVAEDELRRDALRDAVTAAATDWTDTERQMAAGLLDVLWSVPSFERLVVQWGLAADDATRVITWALDLVAGAIRAGISPLAADVGPTEHVNRPR